MNMSRAQEDYSENGRTEKNDRRRERSNDRRITALLHDGVNNRDSQASHNRRERPHADIRHMAGGVAVSNVLEHELSVEAHKPAGEPEEQLRERRVDVEVVLAEDVV